MNAPAAEVDIYALAYGGAGVGKLDGKVCFVNGALPGERVRFAARSRKKRFTAGVATEVITPSGDRTTPVCPYYGRCGGCQYQHLKYDKEVYYKGEQVKEILERIGGVDRALFSGITPSPKDYGYRSSVTVHRGPAGYGYFADDNKTVVSIERCPVAVDKLSEAIAGLGRAFGADLKKDVTIKTDAAGGIWIKGHPGHRFFTDEFMGSRLTFSPYAFSQANRDIALSMVDTLRERIGGKRPGMLFDLYCGVGLFGILLGDLFDGVVGVDEDAVAIDCAQTTKRDMGIDKVKFYRGSSGAFGGFYGKLRGDKNTVVLDPPRQGLSADVVSWLISESGMDEIYYISCDPAILARDIKLLTGNGRWALIEVASFDMFPRTKHIESIACFKAVNKERAI